MLDGNNNNISNIIYYPNYDNDLLYNHCHNKIQTNGGHYLNNAEKIFGGDGKYTITHAHHVSANDDEKNRLFSLKMSLKFQKNDSIIYEKQRLNILSDAEKETLINYQIDIGNTKIIAQRLD